MDLFAPENILTPIPLPDAELAWMGRLELGLGNDEVLAQLIAETGWRADTITLWGRQHLQPRLTAWHGEARYTYSGLTLDPLPFTALQRHILAAVELATGRRFNSVLLNYYRNERDSMGMHSDDEAELGVAPAIASVSFGACRTLVFRHKRSKQVFKVGLTDGSLLLMSGPTQKNWTHGINKSTRPLGPRLNLTFRNIV